MEFSQDEIESLCSSTTNRLIQIRAYLTRVNYVKGNGLHLLPDDCKVFWYQDFLSALISYKYYLGYGSYVCLLYDKSDKEWAVISNLIKGDPIADNANDINIFNTGDRINDDDDEYEHDSDDEHEPERKENT